MSVDLIALDAARKRFWSAIWEMTVEDAAVEYRMDKVKFGPLLALLVATELDDPAVNFVLGAEMPGALEGGHLKDAVAWLESHQVELRVPVLSGSREAVAAEARLDALGQIPAEGPALLVRNVSPLRFFVPPKINVHEHVLAWEAEGLGDPLAYSLGLPGWMSTTFMSLCEANGWHCYSAATSDEILAYAAVSVESEVAMLVLASLSPDVDGRAAVLGPCIAKAAKAGCRFLAVADAGNDPEGSDWDGLVEADFDSVGTYTTWRSPVSARASDGF
ncbi:MAG TPA: hypothetical protein VNL97_08735 [Solirubrobacterales bacterium]|nr:hypothetical protein [Solirubrobacterales bacterium]